MKWLATPDDFANRIHEIILRVHPKVRRTREDEQSFLWQDGTTGYAMMTVVPDDNRVSVMFIKFPDLRIRGDEMLPYAEASLKAVAHTIWEWITELKAPLGALPLAPLSRL
jgi:hypothetical protein